MLIQTTGDKRGDVGDVERCLGKVSKGNKDNPNGHEMNFGQALTIVFPGTFNRAETSYPFYTGTRATNKEYRLWGTEPGFEI